MKLREEMTTLKNSKILLVSLLIIAIVALAGCARYGGTPARYDHNTTRYDQNVAPRGNVLDNNIRGNEGIHGNQPLPQLNRNNLNNTHNTHHNTQGGINNNR